MSSDTRNAIPERPHNHEADAAQDGTLEVTPEETRKLAECCAFFQAEHFRHAQPGAIRESDVDLAQEQIEEIVRHCRRP